MKHTARTLSSVVFRRMGRRSQAPGRGGLRTATWLPMAGVRNVMQDEVRGLARQRPKAGVAKRRGLPDDGNAAGKKNEEEEKDGAREDDAENEFAPRNGPVSGVPGRQGRWSGRKHRSAIVD